MLFSSTPPFYTCFIQRPTVFEDMICSILECPEFIKIILEVELFFMFVMEQNNQW